MYKERDVVKNAWKAVALELHFIENGMQSINLLIIQCFSERMQF